MSVPLPRQRFAGPIENVAKVLGKHYQKNPQYCTYGTVNTGPQVTKLKHHKGLLRDLFALQPNLLYKNSQLMAALGDISSSWGLCKAESAKFKQNDCLKLQVMMTQCKKALGRKTPPPWVLEIMQDKRSVSDLLQALVEQIMIDFFMFKGVGWWCWSW